MSGTWSFLTADNTLCQTAAPSTLVATERSTGITVNTPPGFSPQLTLHGIRTASGAIRFTGLANFVCTGTIKGNIIDMDCGMAGRQICELKYRCVTGACYVNQPGSSPAPPTRTSSSPSPVRKVSPSASPTGQLPATPSPLPSPAPHTSPGANGSPKPSSSPSHTSPHASPGIRQPSPLPSPARPGASPSPSGAVGPPVIDQISPQTLPLEGTRLTLMGRGFDSVETIIVNVTQVTLYHVRESNRVIFDAPAMDHSGYQTLHLLTVDGHYYDWPSILFYGNSCPDDAHYGIAPDCMKCPVGADCPGGYRLWPKPGYYKTGDGAIIKCSNSAACTGGHDSGCAEGYEGKGCSSCSHGYVMKGVNTCTKKVNVTKKTGIIVAICVVLGLIGVGVGVIFYRRYRKAHPFNVDQANRYTTVN